MKDDWDITEVITQPMNFNQEIGIAFRFTNGCRHAFRMPVGSSIEGFIKGAQLIQKWVQERKEEDRISTNLSGV